MSQQIAFYLYSSVLLFLLTSCASINASSRDHLSTHQSTIVLALDANTTQRALLDEFEARGFQRIERRTIENATIVKFKGSRTTHTTGTADTVSSTTIGSVFLARIEPVSNIETSLLLFGKPTADGQEICSDDDWENTTCENKITGIMWPGRDLMIGRAEAETIQSVFLSLEDRIEKGDVAPIDARKP